MKLKPRIIKNIKRILNDDTLDIQERSFILLSFIAVGGLIAALLSGILMSQAVITSVLTFVGIIILAVMVFFILWTRSIKRSMIIITGFMLLVFQPVIFFTSSAAFGGTPVWFLFAVFYIVVIFKGRLRAIFLAIQFVVVSVCYYIGYHRPDIVIHYTRAEAHIDSAVAIVISVIVMGIIVLYQTNLHKKGIEQYDNITKEIGELGRTRSRFFSSMSHELRTPINTILGLNEVMLKREDLTDELRNDAVMIRMAGKQLLSQVNDILDMSKIESGKMTIVEVEYNVSDLISVVVNSVWAVAEKKGLEFKADIDPSIPSVLLGDEVRIKQVIINLLNNALTFTRTGYIALHMECEKKGEDYVALTISIQDTGIGIKKDMIPNVFDAYSGNDINEYSNPTDTGLGLAISKHLVELMGGQIGVSSVYTEGSIFTVTLKQKVMSDSTIGNINIANYGSGEITGEQVTFRAPEARILIVDDNELNLEVERKLLAGTEIDIHTVTSGKKALENTLEYEYDLILMDHLMPEMDGIECLFKLRRQKEGYNWATPVVVLTANAGSDNSKLYKDCGFEGYLSKPVTADALQRMLIKVLPDEKVILDRDDVDLNDNISTASGYSKKMPVLITTSSVCDIPNAVLKKLDIPVIPFMVHTDRGSFRDNVDIVSTELLKYMEDENRKVVSGAPTEENFEKFFAENLRRANNIIHITFTSNMSNEYENASAAAESFDNVTVYDSNLLSSSMGIMVLIAQKLAQEDNSVEYIVHKLDILREKIHCSFILSSTEYMRRKNFISTRLHRLMRTLAMRPSIGVKPHSTGVENIYIGTETRCFKSYIRQALHGGHKMDKDILFLTYAGIDDDRLEWIASQIKRKGGFEHIVFMQASAAISSNCGPGSFGLLFMDKSDREYRLSDLFFGEV